MVIARKLGQLSASPSIFCSNDNGPKARENNLSQLTNAPDMKRTPSGMLIVSIDDSRNAFSSILLSLDAAPNNTRFNLSQLLKQSDSNFSTLSGMRISIIVDIEKQDSVILLIFGDGPNETDVRDRQQLKACQFSSRRLSGRLMSLIEEFIKQDDSILTKEEPV